MAAGVSVTITSRSMALAITIRRSSAASGLSTYTRARDSSAAFTSNDGFSVVAPMNVIVPFSTCGRKASCWALLKRWTSSMNSTVVSPCCRAASASAMAARTSFTPDSTAD